MPELPEVHTTATILHKLVKGRKIIDVWTDYKSDYHAGRENIKDPKYFAKFRRNVMGKKIVGVWRRAKNVLIDISGDQTISIHMKMTGHLLYGKYFFDKSAQENFRQKFGQASTKNLRQKIKTEKQTGWRPVDSKSPLADPFNRFVHLVFVLDNDRHIAFSDMRKFATVHLISDKLALAKKFEKVGPEPLEDKFDWKIFRNSLMRRPNYKIKTALMDQSLVAGIGNIYSDEILWATKIHPERSVSKISDKEWQDITASAKKLLSKGIDFGGDSMSDYRNPHGMRGEFQNHHAVYQRKGAKCLRRSCAGQIVRKMVGQRSAHFCENCQQ